MMLDPVLKSEGNERKPKFWLMKSVASIAMRARVDAMAASPLATARSLRPRLIWAAAALTCMPPKQRRRVVSSRSIGKEEP